MGWLRHPHTTQERRSWYSAIVDVLPRARRAPHALPQLWDDSIRNKGRSHRSWKVHRKNKWKD